MKGTARACGAGTIINAISTGFGGAFAIDLFTEATVEIGRDFKRINGEIEGGGDTTLIKNCVKLVLDRFNYDFGAYVKTKSNIPMAKGLKSSSAASNATVLATLSALKKGGYIDDDEMLDDKSIIDIGVDASLLSRVTITGAFDDACASYLGGIVLTENYKREITKRLVLDRNVLILVPDESIYTIDIDIDSTRYITYFVKLAYNLAMQDVFEEAMTLNGILYTFIWKLDQRPIISALSIGINGVTLSGTGSAYVAWVDQDDMSELMDKWKEFDGQIISTKINNKGAKIID
ncbi:MAG: shikimate kinase [Candidatus Methanoliparum thermophilum]|uniref:Shikimate kinase n=1 Tax=Methanoliparum thermophilum TaxID=2491083 RepID=A0A520KTG8_METT2|nr:shikimate kinase [Candidatus Methanoliparum sp. LAM-1]RZN65384.1 MAG: shikimate kinase [Candidatus Methanoliparum thermophilum]BDC35530.1 shikimate kinase [Candidatus Methanoliparum sp. LAM-1]